MGGIVCLLSLAPTPIFPSAYIQEMGHYVGERLPSMHKSLLIFGNTFPLTPGFKELYLNI